MYGNDFEMILFLIVCRVSKIGCVPPESPSFVLFICTEVSIGGGCEEGWRDQFSPTPPHKLSIGFIRFWVGYFLGLFQYPEATVILRRCVGRLNWDRREVNCMNFGFSFHIPHVPLRCLSLMTGDVVLVDPHV